MCKIYIFNFNIQFIKSKPYNYLFIALHPLC